MESRREFLRMLVAAGAIAPGCVRSAASEQDGPLQDRKQANVIVTAEHPKSKTRERMPVLFVGHGSPMNALEDNRYSRGFSELAELVPRPSAILAISAHWFVNGTYLTGDLKPKTIHDFSGFPQPLYEIQYPAPGSVNVAQRVRSLLGERQAALSSDWGLDHGTWSVLHRMFPKADIPVIQLSIDRRLEPSKHYELAKSLGELRYEGVLILGSGNVVHNLRDAFQRMQTGATDTPEWASRFDRTVEQATTQHDEKALLSLWPSQEGRLAHPSPDHWLPLIYAAAASDEQDRVRFPMQGFDLGSISMRSVLFG